MSWRGWWIEFLQATRQETQEGLAPESDAASAARAPLRRLQRASGNRSMQQLFGHTQDNGQPLDSTTRARMEQGFGENLADVRVHPNAEAGSHPVTIGQDIFLTPRQYNPNSVRGDHVLAHEVAHVIQQRRGGAEQPGPAHEADADRAAAAVAHGGTGAVATATEYGVPQGGPGDDAPKILNGPTETITVEINGTKVNAPYRMMDVMDAPASMDNFSMRVRNRAFAAQIANPNLTEMEIARMQQSQLPTEVTVRQLRTYAQTKGLKANVLVAEYAGGEHLAGYDTYRLGELQPNESVSFRNTMREGYVEGALGTRGAGRNLMVRRITATLEANAKLMQVSVGSFEETVAFHEKLVKAADLPVNVDVGKSYWLDTKAMANVLAEWGDNVLTPTQRQALRDLVRAAEASNKPIPVEAIKRILNAPKPVVVVKGGGGGPKEGGGGTEGGGPKESPTTVTEGEGKLGGGVREGGTPGKGGGGGGGSGLLGKAMLAVGLYLSGKHLIEAWGTEDFDAVVVQEGMTWGSAFTPLGPLGPPTMALMFWYGDKFGQAMVTTIEMFASGIEVLDTFADYSNSFVSSIFFGQTIVLYESLDPSNWDYRSVPADKVGPINDLGVALWDRLSKMNLEDFRNSLYRPLGELGLPSNVIKAYAQVSLLPDPIAQMTPAKLVQSFRSDRLRFIRDPDVSAAFQLNVDEPELEQGEKTRVHDLVEIHAMLNPYNWELNDLPNIDTRDRDKAAIMALGKRLWEQLENLDRAEFQRMSLMGLTSFTFSGDMLERAAAGLSRLSFPYFEMTQEMIDLRKQTLLEQTPQDLLAFLRTFLRLRFKNSPTAIADEAVEQVRLGYQPW